MSTGYGWEGLRQVCATLLGARHVPERLCGGRVYTNGRYQVLDLYPLFAFSKLSTESVGSRRELVANCVHTADADATKQFRRVGVGGVYWAYTLWLVFLADWLGVSAIAAILHNICTHGVSQTIPEVFWHDCFQTVWIFSTKLYVPVVGFYPHSTTNFYLIICNFDEVMPY